MAGISSAGIGSGLDVNGLINSLMSAEAQAPSQRLNLREARTQAEISAWGSIKGALSAFQSSFSALKNLSTYAKRSTTVSDGNILSASAATTALSGSYSVEVSALAKAHSLASPHAYAQLSDTVGTGTLTFRFGSWSGSAGSYSFSQNGTLAQKSITIDSSNNTLAGVRDAINKANMGVRAAIVNDGSGNRLVVTSGATGAASAMEIAVSGATGDLADFAFDAASRNDAVSGNNFLETVTAQNAAATINGLPISSASNTLSEALPGVTLTLKGTTSGAPVTVGVSQDKASVSKALNDFVEGYNKLIGAINEVSSYNAETKQGGILLGDATLRGVKGTIRDLLNQKVDGVAGPYQRLLDVGVKSDSKGHLSIDSSKLNTALENNFDEIAGLFTTYARASDPLVSVKNTPATARAGSYAFDVSRIASQGSLLGSGGITSLLLDGSNNSFSLNVDGSASGTITLNNGSYASSSDFASLAAEMQAKINADSALLSKGIKVGVSYDSVNGRFAITSEKYGSSSQVSVTVANSGLGLDAGSTSNSGVDAAATLGGMQMSGAGRVLTAGSGSTLEGTKLELLGGNTGSRGTVSISHGVFDQLDTLLGNYLSSKGAISARSDGAQQRINQIQKEREMLATRLDAMEQRYRRQFTALDTLMSKLQATGNALTGQLASLPGMAPKP